MIPPDRDIPAAVLRFIDENIGTVPQLETLLLMSDSGARAWLAGEVAAQNYTTLQHAQAILDALRRRGLVMPDPSGAGFQFASSPELRELVGEVGRYYRANLSRVATYIHSKPSASITEFARAFDLKKDR